MRVPHDFLRYTPQGCTLRTATTQKNNYPKWWSIHQHKQYPHVNDKGYTGHLLADLSLATSCSPWRQARFRLGTSYPSRLILIVIFDISLQDSFLLEKKICHLR